MHPKLFLKGIVTVITCMIKGVFLICGQIWPHLRGVLSQMETTKRLKISTQLTNHP